MSLSNLGFGRKLGFGIASILIAVAAINATLFSILKTSDHACQPQDQFIDLVDATGKVLSRIFEKVAELDSVVSTIARGAQEEATALQQVNIASNEMDRIAQQNTAMVEETTAATHVLRQESEELVRLISCFNVGPERESDTVSIRRKSGRPATALQTAARKGVFRRVEAFFESPSQHWLKIANRKVGRNFDVSRPRL